MEYFPVITAFFGAAAGVIAPFLIPKFSDFLLARSIERYKLTLLQSQRPEKITRLFAYMPPILSGKALTQEDEIKINQLILELSLYLPKDLVCELSETICIPEKRGRYKDCFVKIRAYVRGRDDGLIGDNISHITLLPVAVPNKARIS
jgi:hypothetical protein